MNKRILLWLLVTVCSCTVSRPPRRSSRKIPRIGYLGSLRLPASPPASRHSARGCASLATSRGKTLSLSVDMQREKLDRLPRLAAELVRLKVDIIVTAGRQQPVPPRKQPTTIPIVMAQDDDPVGNGFVASLARPGGNITGLSTLAPELSGKQLELLKEIVPKLSRVAVFGTSTNPGTRTIVKRDGTRRSGVRSCSFNT